jgi:murein L,D-transpeptidase YafK
MLSLLLACAIQSAPADTFRVVLAGATTPAPATARVETRAKKMLIADSMVLEKSSRQLTLYYHGQTVRQYAVALGKNPVGDKVHRGDGRTPEGLFYIEGRNPQSKYHMALRISYPDAAHRRSAAKRGETAGGDIMIHGLPDAFASVGALHRQQDWTLGCIAVTNEEIEEIWRAVPDGARILIKP